MTIIYRNKTVDLHWNDNVVLCDSMLNSHAVFTISETVRRRLNSCLPDGALPNHPVWLKFWLQSRRRHIAWHSRLTLRYFWPSYHINPPHTYTHITIIFRSVGQSVSQSTGRTDGSTTGPLTAGALLGRRATAREVMVNTTDWPLLAPSNDKATFFLSFY